METGLTYRWMMCWGQDISILWKQVGLFGCTVSQMTLYLSRDRIFREYFSLVDAKKNILNRFNSWIMQSLVVDIRQSLLTGEISRGKKGELSISFNIYVSSKRSRILDIITSYYFIMLAHFQCSYRQDKLGWLNFTQFFTCYWNKSGELLSPDFLFRCLKGTIDFFHTLWKVTHVPTHFTYLKVAFCEDVKFSSNFIFYFECLAEISSKYYHINLFQVINQCLCWGIRKD